LNGSNQLGLSGIADNAINSAKIVDASIANIDIVDPWVGITAGAGLWSSSTTLNLGQLITMKVLTDDSTVTVINDTLHVLGGAGTLDSSGVREIVSDTFKAYFPVDSADIARNVVSVTHLDTNEFYGLKQYSNNSWGVSPDNVYIEVQSTASLEDTFLVTTGSYTGNGSSQSITGLGFSPKLVLVKGNTAQYGYWKCDAHTGTNSTNTYESAPETDAITALDSDGFSVGGNAGVNGNSVVYHFMAVYGSPEFMETGTYTGSGGDNRDIVLSGGWEPGLVWIKANAAGAWNAWRSSSLTGDSTAIFHKTVRANFIQALNSDGFEVGTTLNGSSVTYVFVAFANNEFFLQSGKYTGDGTDNRNISVGYSIYRPGFLMVDANADNVYSRFRLLHFDGDVTASTSATAFQSDYIQQMTSGSFQVGTSTAVNANGNRFFWWALRTYNPSPGTFVTLKDSSITLQKINSSVLTQIRQEISDSILANATARVANGLIHEYRWNSDDARTDSIHDPVNTFDMYGVGQTWSGGYEPHLTRVWNYPDFGFTFAVNRFIGSDNENEMDVDEDYTFEMGLFFNSAYTEQTTFESIFSKGVVATSTLNYHLYRRSSDGLLAFGFYNGSLRTVIDSSGVLEKDTWYQIGVSVSADSIFFFRNGTRSWAKPLPAALVTNNGSFIMGGDHNGGIATSFFGQMLYFRMYGKILDAGEITQNYNVEAVQFRKSTYFQDYQELDPYFAKTRLQYPDSATTGNPLLYAVLYNGDIDTWRVFYYRKADRTLRMATSTDSLQTLSASTKIDTLAAVPAIFYDSVGDTTWLFAQDWVNLGAGDTTIYAWYSVDTGATWSSKQVAYTGTPNSPTSPVLDPYVFKNGSTYYLAVANGNLMYLLSSTKPGTGFANPQLISVTAETGFESVIEGPTFELLNGTWYFYYSVLGARRYTRYATASNLSAGGFTRQDYGLKIMNGFKRKSAWGSTLIRPVVIVGDNKLNTHYNYYAWSVADGSSISGGGEQFYRLMLLKRRKDIVSQIYIDNAY